MGNLINPEILSRMQKVAEKKNAKELAEFLNVPSSTLSTWKNKTSIPLEILINFSQKVECDLNWLITGSSKEKTLETSERMLLTAFNDLTDAQKMQAVVFVGNLAKNSEKPTESINQTVGGDGFNINVKS